MQLPSALLSLSSKKKKKSNLKNFLYFLKNRFSYISANGIFLYFLALKILFYKHFYTLNETPLGEIGCLSNVYYLLATFGQDTFGTLPTHCVVLV